jgi:hypothetical protein
MCIKLGISRREISKFPQKGGDQSDSIAFFHLALVKKQVKHLLEKGNIIGSNDCARSEMS